MSTIRVGVTGWRDHHSLYEAGAVSNRKLEVYAGHFPIVELDSSFYAIPSENNITKWLNETPESFQFMAKAYQGMTGHQRGDIPYSSRGEMFQAFKDAFTPMQKAGKLGLVLCQFPPWFDCKKEHVDYLKVVREELREFDTALEFRNRTWYSGKFQEKTLRYMESDRWIHSICDEPQVGERSVPFVPVTTVGHKAYIRFHGRNKAAWTAPVKGEEWREVRYLYDYSLAELKKAAVEISKISKNVKETFVVFNNNSGGHAAGNALAFIKELGVVYDGLAPKQLNLFDDLP